MGETINKCGLKGYIVVYDWFIGNYMHTSVNEPHLGIVFSKNMGSTIKNIGRYNEELIEN